MFPPSSQHHLPHTTARKSEVQQSPVVRYSLGLLGLILLIYSLKQLDNVLLPLAFAMLFAFLLLPVSRKLESWRWPRWLAIVACLLLVMLVLAGIFWGFGSQLTQFSEEWPRIQQKLLVYFDDSQRWLARRFHINPVSREQLIDATVARVQKDAGKYLNDTLNMTTDVLSTVTLVPIYIFCLLYYRDHFRQFMFRFISPDKRTSVMHTVDNVQSVVQAYISGLLTVIAIVAVLNGIGLLVLGVKFALFFAIFASVLAVIPYIGIFIGAALPTLLTLIDTGSPGKALAVVGVFAFVQFLEGNFITPYITGSKVSINPMAAIIALVLGGELWGTPGMILSIPLTAMLKVVFDAYKPTEPLGFLLGDVASGEDNPTEGALRDEPGRVSSLKSIWNKLVGAKATPSPTTRGR